MFMNLCTWRWWGFAALLFAVYAIALTGLILAFHGSVQLDPAKFLEESAKLLVTYLLALAALALSQHIEQGRIRQQANARRTVTRDALAQAKSSLETLCSLDAECFASAAVEQLRQAQEKRISFNKIAVDLAGSVEPLFTNLLEGEPQSTAMNGDLVKGFAGYLVSHRNHQRDQSAASAASVRSSAAGLLTFIEAHSQFQGRANDQESA